MRQEFNRKKLIQLPEVYTALCNVNTENIMIKDTQMLSTLFSKTVTLEEFETIQSKIIFEVIFFCFKKSGKVGIVLQVHRSRFC